MKFSYYILYFLSTLCFFSCSGEKDEGKIRIGFSQAMSNDDWRRSMNNSMRLQASLNPKIDLTIKDANYDVATQIEQIESLIADSLDVLIVSPIQSEPITSVVKKALNAGIPVLVVDRKTKGQQYTAYLGADNGGCFPCFFYELHISIINRLN